MQRFVPWLRNEANMRSAAVVAAAEYVKAGGAHSLGDLLDLILRQILQVAGNDNANHD